MEKNWALPIDQCQLQALQISVHLIDLLSTLLRCNGFTRIQKTVVDQTSSRPPNSDSDLSFDTSALELLLSPTTELVITSCHIKSTFHHMSQSNQEMVHCCCCIEKVKLQNDNLEKLFSQLMSHPLIKLFHLSNFLQMLNDHRRVSVEFFRNFSCSWKRISFDDGSQFSSVQFSSVTQSCATLTDYRNHSTPGLPVHHQLPEFT